MTGTVNLLKKMVALVHVIDPTRAAAIGGVQIGDLGQYGDVAGYNGDGATKYMNPAFPNMVSEYGSCVESRRGRINGFALGAPQETASPASRTGAFQNRVTIPAQRNCTATTSATQPGQPARSQTHPGTNAPALPPA